MSKYTDQVLEGVEFLLELQELARELQTNLDSNVRDAGIALEMILIKYGIYDR